LASCRDTDEVSAPGQTPLVGKAAASPQAPDVVRLKKFSYVDSTGMGCEAFSLLTPVGWEFSGGIDWVFDNPGMPATARFRVKNPAGSEELEVFPNQAMFWTDNQMLLATFPVGSRYFGAEVRPVLGPQEALASVVIPRFRGKARGLAVVGSEHLPELAKALHAGAPQPGVRAFGDAAKVRIEYSLGGIPMEEEIFAVVEGFSFSMQGMQGIITNTNWYVDYIFSFKAEKGGLHRAAPQFQAMINSFRVNPQWFSRYNQLVEALIQAQIRQIRSIGELSRYISRTSSEISDSMMQSYNERQKVYDRIGEKVSESIRGTERYVNPLEGSEVELPGGYSHVWTNPLGEYLLTDSPSYNPNEESNGNWQEIQRKP
ncbi:MAG TPA: hypothetical protein PLU54_13680, partial [Deltaproteobacteria bacterium]|nr:hypothetical protein [Deltaproteobacteria bacterium]